MVHALGLDERRATLVVRGWSATAGGEEFALALGHERLVFTVGGDDHPEFSRQRERPVKLAVVNAERSLVREEKS